MYYSLSFSKKGNDLGQSDVLMENFDRKFKLAQTTLTVPYLC